MPRTIDPEKYEYAKILLAQNKPIADIRNELKNIFNSAISPNRLIKLKKEIENERLIKNPGDSSHPIPFLTQNKKIIEDNPNIDELVERTSQNTILIQKLWRSFQEYERFLNFLNPMIQSINEKLERLDLKAKNIKETEREEDKFFSDENLLEELHKRRAIIMDILDRYEQLDINDINKYSGIDINILEWNLHELTEFGMVEQVENDNRLEYRYKKFVED